LISSPTIRGESRIDKEYQLGTREELHVPCPHCGEYQFLVWGGTEIDFGLKWEPGKPDTAYYVCEHNGCIIEEHSKAEMISKYRFIAQNPSAGPRRRSFWKNLLASNLIPWRKLVQEWLEVQGKPLELQVFINTVQCELFDPIEGEEVEVDSLLRRLGKGYPKDNDRGTGTVPAGVAILTRSVDVQGDRLETCVWGWGANETSWLIEHELIPGDPSTIEPWTKLDEIMRGATTTPRVSASARASRSSILAVTTRSRSIAIAGRDSASPCSRSRAARSRVLRSSVARRGRIRRRRFSSTSAASRERNL
jgi:phage terminase large subunit GpA-like protein